MGVFNSTTDALANTASTLYSGARGVAEQTMQGWENTKDQVEVPEWLKKVLRIPEELGSIQYDIPA